MIFFCTCADLDRENSSNSQVSVEDEKAHPDPVSTKKPTMVPLPTDLTAMQVDCGTFHTGEGGRGIRKGGGGRMPGSGLSTSVIVIVLLLF